MSTLKQKQAISKTCENLRNNEPQPLGKVMRSSGYSNSTSKHPKVLTESNAWKEAMSSIDYAKHLRQLSELADTSINNDKDNVLRSKKMLFDLGDKFPQKESKLVGLFKDM